MARKVLDLAIPPEVLSLKVGDTCRVKAHFDYIGPRLTEVILYAAIGIKNLRFNHILTGSKKNWVIPATSTVTTYTIWADIPITPISVGSYDVYVKMMNVPGPDIYSPFYENVIKIVEVAPPGFSISIFAYPPNVVDYRTAKYWIAQFSPWHWSGWLDITEDWVFPYSIDSQTDFLEVIVVDKDYNTLHSHRIDAVTLKDGGSYQYNCLTKKLTEV